MHSYIPELREQCQQGKLSRREFLRLATLLGLSLGAAEGLLAGCSPAQGPTPGPTPAPAKATSASVPTAAAAAPTTAAVAGTIKRGGELKVAMPIQQFKDPATSAWYENNIYRHVVEFLTFTDWNNITHPWLLEKWEASEDLKSWTLRVRKGIKFNHGPELNADDVIFNFKRWLDPAVGSSMNGLLGSFLTPADIERVDDYTVKLHLSKPQLALPENLFNKNGVVLPKDFQGDWMKQPYGTGPFTVQEYVVGERVVLKRREGYWRQGADGKALPYLDSIRFVHLGNDQAPAVAALTTGEIDLLWRPEMAARKALAGKPGIKLATQSSGSTDVIRMRVDKKPFDDVRVRHAIKLCQDRQRFLDVTEGGVGSLGEDHHVSPVHPEYSPGEIPKRDVEKAKALLKEAGYANGLDVTIQVKNSEPSLPMAQLLKEQCAPAGINVKIEPIPDSLYNDKWTELDFGITSWAHRALGTMVLSLCYRKGAPWNETKWSNPEFEKMLDKAEATLDVNERRKIMSGLQKILQEDGGIALPRWRGTAHAHSDKVQNFKAAPSDQIFLWEVWLDK